MSKTDQPEQHRLKYFTPLRYPGGKAKLAPFIKILLKQNRLIDGDYVEPYAGGAGIALELLIQEYVSRVYINDVNKALYAFWKSVLNRTEEFCRLVSKTPITVPQWDKQKRILRNAREHDLLELGFAFFFLNRTNRSGILNGGIIGGRDQVGPWKIDARYNPRELVRRIQTIARFAGRIKVTRQDALTFLRSGVARWPQETLIYLDPPYFVKGRDLYYDYYKPEDHEELARFTTSGVIRQHWIVSYDNVAAIRELYKGSTRAVYSIGYSARRASRGSEVMYFCKDLKLPLTMTPIQTTRILRGRLRGF